MVIAEEAVFSVLEAMLPCEGILLACGNEVVTGGFLVRETMVVQRVCNFLRIHNLAIQKN